MTNEEQRPSADQPIRVIDLSDTPEGGYAARLLATHGVEVLKVEPPDGSGYRLTGPYADDDPDPDKALLALFLDCSKKSLVLDLELGTDRDVLDQLLETADAVITTDQAGTGNGFLTPDRLATRHPHLVVTSVTPFGLDGPYAELPASPIVLEAMSGWLYQTGEPAGEPVRIRGQLSSAAIPGLYAAIGTLAALRWRRRGGGGQTVEISNLEAMVASNRYFETHYAQVGEYIGRCGAMLYPFYGYTPAADGWTAPCAVTGRHAQLLADMMGSPSIPTAEELEQWFATQDRTEIFHRGQAHKIPWGYLATAPEVLEHEQLRVRDAFVRVDHPIVGPLDLPTTADHQTIIGASVDRPPLLGEHTGDLADLLARNPATTPEPREVPPSLPLEGVRVLDVTSWWAGPMAAMILADLGAEVIKIESIQKMDAWRTTLADVDAETPWETSPLYNGAGRNKISLTLDLTNSTGAQLLRDLVAQSDVLIENLQPKVLPSLGLGYENLRDANPLLVMISQSGFGQTGPWRDYASLAQVGESLAGVGLITGHADGRPMLAGHFIGDSLSATHAAFATLAALDERDRTQTGQHVDLSQLESSLPVAAEALLDYQLNGRTWGRIGNRHPYMAPHGCYPTVIEDEWLVLAIASDDEWHRLAHIINQPWALDPDLATAAARIDAADRIDSELLSWIVPQTRDELVATLRALGLRTGPVQNPAGVLADRHLEQRAFFQMIDRPHVGRLPYPSLGIGFSQTPTANRLPAPLLGQHNHDVLSRVLGLDDGAIEKLHRERVIGTVPIAPPAPITLD